MNGPRSEEERAAAIEAVARRKWDARERMFPARCRQAWADASFAARAEMLDLAEREFVQTYRRENAR